MEPTDKQSVVWFEGQLTGWVVASVKILATQLVPIRRKPNFVDIVGWFSLP